MRGEKIMNKITFPHMGFYYIPINYLLENITKKEIIIPPKITKKTIELGSKYSPQPSFNSKNLSICKERKS